LLLGKVYLKEIARFGPGTGSAGSQLTLIIQGFCITAAYAKQWL